MTAVEGPVTWYDWGAFEAWTGMQFVFIFILIGLTYIKRF